MNITTKILAFEYLLTQLIMWGKEQNPQVSVISYTRLKVLKLLFFTAAIKNEDGSDLLDVFDNFYALPNGPVESDVYNSITSDSLSYYTFSNFSFGKKAEYNDDGLDIILRQRIDKSISTLRSKNERLIAYSAEQLVILSHYWLSWQNSIQIAIALGKGSYRMDVNKIRSNAQFFML